MSVRIYSFCWIVTPEMPEMAASLAELVAIGSRFRLSDHFALDIGAGCPHMVEAGDARYRL